MNKIAVDRVALKLSWNQQTLGALRALAPPAEVRSLLSQIDRAALARVTGNRRTERLLIGAAEQFKITTIREDDADPIRQTGSG